MDDHAQRRVLKAKMVLKAEMAGHQAEMTSEHLKTSSFSPVIIQNLW